MLNVSETFHSLQGEGKTVGCPAIFLRLQHCNLRCGEGGGEWVCDTLDVWQKGEPFSNEQLYKLWKKDRWLQHLQDGTHLVVTGGEPLLQQRGLHEFLSFLAEHGTCPFVEIETNGTIVVEKNLDRHVSLYNCSPKLETSGNSKRARQNNAAIKWFVQNPKTIFKFVIATDEDINEIDEFYVKPHKIAANRVWLMPASQTREELQKRAKEIALLCKTRRFNYSTRLQLEIWDKATGV